MTPLVLHLFRRALSIEFRARAISQVTTAKVAVSFFFKKNCCTAVVSLDFAQTLQDAYASAVALDKVQRGSRVQGISFSEDIMMRKRKVRPASPCGFISRRCHFRESRPAARKRKGGKRLSATAASALPPSASGRKEGRPAADRAGAAAREGNAKLPASPCHALARSQSPSFLDCPRPRSWPVPQPSRVPI